MRPGVHSPSTPDGHNVALTDAGIPRVEARSGCGNLFDERQSRLYTRRPGRAARARPAARDVDYVVKNGAVEMVDEFKGRIAHDRRWPAGLHTAIEAKEGVAAKTQGHDPRLDHAPEPDRAVPAVCGMTGTAATQSLEFRTSTTCEVETIPTNRPVIRVDHPDVVFATKAEKEQAVIEEIRRAHRRGQPVLVGTASVAESERLSALLAGRAARGAECAQRRARGGDHRAGRRARRGDDSTNMAGRGTDIRLGDGVAELVVDDHQQNSGPLHGGQ